MQSLDKLISLAARFEKKLHKYAEKAIDVQQKMRRYLPELDGVYNDMKDPQDKTNVGECSKQIRIDPKELVPNHLKSVGFLLRPYVGKYPQLRPLVELADSITDA